jgi:hypothetical protein
MPPIEIDAPDGSIVEFPEGTPDDVITRAMAQNYPSRRPSGYTDAQGAAATLGGLGFRVNEPITGLFGGIGDVLTAPLRGDLRPMGEQFSSGYRRESSRTRALRNQFIEDRPLAGNFTEGTGAAVPIVAATIASGGTATPQMLGSRVAQNTLAQGAERAYAGEAVRRAAIERAGRGGLGGVTTRAFDAGGAGALYGYGTGLTNYEDDPNLDQVGNLTNRFANANFSGGVGAVTGVAIPPAIAGIGALSRNAGNALAPAWEGAANMARRFTLVPADNTLGALGGNLGAGGRPRVPPPNRPPPMIPPEAIGTIERLANRSRMTPQQVGSELGQARRNPQGEVLVDIFREPGIQTFRSLTQGPGQTSQRARDIATQRILAASGRIDQAARQALIPDGRTRGQVMAGLEDDYRRLSVEAYQPLWRERWTPRQEALYQQRIVPFLRDPGPVGDMVRRAEREARETFALDVANGRVRGTFDENRARALHYLKMELGDVFEAEALRSSGARSTRDAARRSFYRTFADLIDPPPTENGQAVEAIIPGYREITNLAGDYHAAQRALRAGGRWLTMAGDEVAAERAAMTQFERYHARVALADSIRTAAQGTVDGARNPVTLALRRPSTQDAIRAAFDDPEQAAEFLSTLNRQRELADNALRWNSGSSSYSNAMHGADEMLNAGADATASAATGNPGAAAGRLARWGINAATLGRIESRNNRVGEVLSRRVDDPESEAFAREVERLLMERQNRASVQSAAGRAGAVQQSGARNREDRR